MRTLHKCMTKAVTSEEGGPGHAFSWARARRGLLEVTDEEISLGQWKIRYEEIEEATLLSTRQMFIPGFILRVRARGVTYHFGLNWGRFWKGELPFPVERKRARLRRSWIRLTIRFLTLALIVYWLWTILNR
ncbi:MAG: hypothetical protein V2A76_17415 [Planctomycetota bacterium]